MATNDVEKQGILWNQCILLITAENDEEEEMARSFVPWIDLAWRTALSYL